MNLFTAKTINLNELIFDALIVAFPYLYTYILGDRLLIDLVAEYTGYIGLILVFFSFSHIFTRYLYNIMVIFWNYYYTYESFGRIVKALYIFSSSMVFISLSVIGLIIVDKGYGGFSLNGEEFLPSIASITFITTLIIPPLFNFLSKGEISFLQNLLITFIIPISCGYLYSVYMLTKLLSTGYKIIDSILFILNFLIFIPLGIALICLAIAKIKRFFIGDLVFDKIQDTISSFIDFIKSSSEKAKAITNSIIIAISLSIFGEISFSIFMKPNMKDYAAAFFVFFLTGILPIRFLMLIEPPISFINIIIGIISSCLYLQKYLNILITQLGF